MPQVTVYVRNEDLDKWKAIDKKAEWLHECINSTPTVKCSDCNYITYSQGQVEAHADQFHGKEVQKHYAVVPSKPSKPKDIKNFLDKKKGTR
jgi:hypothetical protein